MATVIPTVTDSVSRSGAVKQAIWGPITQANAVGDWVSWPEFCGKTFHVYGTFGAGATLSIQGSNETVPTNGNAVVISNWQGTALQATTAGGNTALTARDMPLWVRPSLAGGDGTTTLTVALAAHRQDMATMG